MPKQITVYVNNNAEYLLDRISESEVSEEIHFLHRLGDRSALWRGQNKLLITSAPLHHLEYWKNIVGFHSLVNLWPRKPTVSLSDDILQDATLLEKIVAHCKKADTIELIPWGTTLKFLDMASELNTILSAHGTTLMLPESPERETLWISQYFSTKAGFRHLIAEWFNGQLPCKMPEGYILNDKHEIISAVQSFLRRGKGCVCKPSKAISGLGQIRFLPNVMSSWEDINNVLFATPYMWHMPVVVEELIPASIFPSGEAQVPNKNTGELKLTYICTQLFTEKNYFDGVLIDHAQLSETIVGKIKECIIFVGRKLQSLGYAGIFDLDFALENDRENLYLLEANLRRTGGTHVHETSCILFGDDYIRSRSVLSTSASFSSAVDWENLIEKIKGISFPMGAMREGVIITKSSSLPNKIDYMLFGKNIDRVKLLQTDLRNMLQS